MPVGGKNECHLEPGVGVVPAKLEGTFQRPAATPDVVRLSLLAAGSRRSEIPMLSSFVGNWIRFPSWNLLKKLSS